jgi:hypothetical protein
VEGLEDRTLLSTVHPGYQLLPAAGGVAPLASSSPTGYTPAQIRHAYGFDQIQFPGGIVGDGSGQTIAIVDAFDDPTIQSDLDAFSAKFGLPTTAGKQFTFTKVNETGGSTLPAPSTSWAVEESLDVEWAHAIAPKANILLVEASSSFDFDIYAAIGFAASQPGVSVVSMSFGEAENSGETSLDSQYLVTPGGHAPVAFVASAGDSGAPPEYPSASPNVLAVGGTTLQLDGSGNYQGESAWSGGGGGISAFESQPSYQKGVVTQSSTQRTDPDVAYDADPGTGFPVYDSFTYGSATPWQQVGGTSAGAPQWSALVAIADQGRAVAAEATLDGPNQLLPMIYSLPAADFHDITSGSSAGNPHEPAGPGYDLVTGRGSPLANLIVAGLVGSVSTTPTTTSLTSSANPSVFGQSVTFTAKVSASGGTPGGSVTFMNGTATLGFASLVNGVGTFSTSALATGNSSITAVYAGGSGFAGSTSPALTQTVNQASATVALTSSLNPASFGASVTFTAKVIPTSGVGAPTGSVTFMDGATMLGSVALSSGSASLTTAALPVGSDSITAVYGGDANFTGQTSAALVETVTAATTTMLTSSANPSVYGQSVTFTAQVTSGGGTPGGSVTFLSGTTTLGSATLANGTATFATSSLPTGISGITAVYAGGSGFVGSTSASLTQTVNPASTAVGLTSSQNPSQLGAPVTFTATVAAVLPGAGTPSGTVTFMDGSTTLGSGKLSNGSASLTTANVPLGSNSITAVYAGDNNFTGRTSTALSQTVTPATTTTLLTSGANPSVYGQSVTFTAQVTSGGGTPGGSVAFMNGTTVLATTSLSGGIATYTTSALTQGSYSITAAYAGNGSYAGSTSAVLTQTVKNGLTNAVLTVTPSPATVGQTVTLTVAFSPVAPSTGTINGTVTFKDGTTTLGLVRLSGGVAVLQTAALAAGSHSLTATWGGDSNYQGSVSPAVTEVINAGVRTASTTQLSSNVSPSSVFGQSVTFTATVSGSGGTPTGTVTFLNGSTTLGTGTLSGGTATFTTSTLAPGSYSISAAYGGDGSFLNSTSNAVAQTVNQASANVALSSSLNPSTAGQSVTFTAVVAAVAPGAGTPTGSVTFFDGNSSIGSAMLSGGTSTFSTASLPVGSDAITAVYGGDINFATQTSPALTQTVTTPQQGATATLLSSSQNPSVYGQSVTFTAQVTSGGGTPGGSVTFMNGSTALATVPLSAGVATYSTSTLAATNYSITAVYPGSGSFTGSTSAALTQTVNKGTTSAVLTASPSPATAGQTVTLTAAFSAVAPATGTINGTVTFKDGTTTLGLVRLSGGVAVLQTTLAAGSHNLTAIWWGDSNYNGSVSPTVVLTVNSASGPAVAASLVMNDRVTSAIDPQLAGLLLRSPNSPGSAVTPNVITGQTSAMAHTSQDAVWIEWQRLHAASEGVNLHEDWLLDLILARGRS